MSKLSKEMENWQQAELRHASVFGKAALRTRGYQKIRLAEMQRIHRSHRGGRLSLDDKVRLRMLRAGNRHLEKQLYPNRLERYTRRFVRVAERVVKNGYRRIKQFVAERRPLSNETNVSIHPQKMAAHPLKTKVDATKIVRIPRKPIKQVEGMEQKRSRRI